MTIKAPGGNNSSKRSASSTTANDFKICPVCQKPFQNRKRWASRAAFADVKYCSRRCRGQARSLGITRSSK